MKASQFEHEYSRFGVKTPTRNLEVVKYRSARMFKCCNLRNVLIALATVTLLWMISGGQPSDLFKREDELFVGQSASEHVAVSTKLKNLPKIPLPYMKLLVAYPELFIVEPSLLATLLDDNTYDQLKSGFNLPKRFKWNGNILTVGIFANSIDYKVIERMNNLKNFYETERISMHSNHRHVMHIFYQTRELKPTLHLHLVVFYPIEKFFWVGKIPSPQLLTLDKAVRHWLHFGRHHQIYDPFSVETFVSGLRFPTEIGHLLSQLPTSRYMHCPSARKKWLSRNHLSSANQFSRSSEESIPAMKQLMKSLKMEFWMVCGTLLGWYRQCDITPYTTDVDFATWSRYAINSSLSNITTLLKKEVPKASLSLLYRFGEPSSSLEFSLKNKNGEKVDLFFAYENATHMLTTVHSDDAFVYQAYPKYKLCSVVLRGYKLLAPCNPEEVIVAEYGPNWRKPVSNWNYISSPFNMGKWISWTWNISNFEKF